jgi:hypothetical protein
VIKDHELPYKRILKQIDERERERERERGKKVKKEENKKESAILRSSLQRVKLLDIFKLKSKLNQQS